MAAPQGPCPLPERTRLRVAAAEMTQPREGAGKPWTHDAFPRVERLPSMPDQSCVRRISGVYRIWNKYFETVLT